MYKLKYHNKIIKIKEILGINQFSFGVELDKIYYNKNETIGFYLQNKIVYCFPIYLLNNLKKDFILDIE